MAEKRLCALGRKKNQLPGAGKIFSAPGGRKKQLPGAEKGHSAPGGRKKRLRGAEKGHSAPGGRKKQLTGAEKGHSAPGAGCLAIVRWTRSDFRGCTWYTQCGSEEVLGRGRCTWYRPSKWTWSTAVSKKSLG